MRQKTALLLRLSQNKGIAKNIVTICKKRGCAGKAFGG